MHLELQGNRDNQCVHIAALNQNSYLDTALDININLDIKQAESKHKNAGFLLYREL